MRRVSAPAPSPADHLRAFVERVASDDDGPSEARVRAAMAGESAARFRDRLLLERAAYLTRATGRRLQDIAVECGFRGYDVFTRAFRRELGALPSQWRAEPTSWAVDAPGDVHFHPHDGLRLPARARVDAVDLVVDMVVHHVRAVDDLLASACTVPATALDAVADGTTLRAVLAELVDRIERIPALVHETAYDAGDPGPLTSLRERLDRVGPDVVDVVVRLAATGRFDEAFVDAFSPEPTAVSFGAMVTALVTDADGLLHVARDRLRGLGANSVSAPVAR